MHHPRAATSRESVRSAGAMGTMGAAGTKSMRVRNCMPVHLLGVNGHMFATGHSVTHARHGNFLPNMQVQQMRAPWAKLQKVAIVQHCAVHGAAVGVIELFNS